MEVCFLTGKATTALLITVCGAAAFWGVRYLKESGILYKRPQPRYLTEDEASVRPVYAALSKKEQAIYEALCRGIGGHKENIPLPYDVDGDIYSRVYCIVEKQESEFFYLDSVYYTAEKVRDAKIVYRDNEAAAAEGAEALAAAKEAALAKIPLTSDYDKIMYINDYLVENCQYYTGGDADHGSTAYGCLVEGRASCEGYAKAFDLLASGCGLESVLITGTTDTGENHAWNQVRSDGEWYNIDVTWADTDEYNDVRRAYFLVEDDSFGRTHFADCENFEPFSCTAVEDNYYIKNGLYAESMAEGEDILRRELNLGETAVELRFSCEEAYDEFKSRFFTDKYIFTVMEECGIDLSREQTATIKECAGDYCLTVYIE